MGRISAYAPLAADYIYAYYYTLYNDRPCKRASNVIIPIFISPRRIDSNNM